jgi:hypothetical protein
MRTHLLLFAILLLSAIGPATAQPFVGPEIATARIANYGGHALATDGDGFVFAWIDANRVFVTRLDATLHEVPGMSPVALPAFTAGATLAGPSLASDGRNIVVAWQEQLPGGATQSIYAAVARDLVGLTVAPRVLDNSPVRLSVRYAGGRWVLLTDWIYELDAQLAVKSTRPSSATRVVGVSESGDVAVASLQQKVLSCSGVFITLCDYDEQLSITSEQFSGVFEYAGKARVFGGNLSISSNGSGFVVGWERGREPYVSGAPGWQFIALMNTARALTWRVTTTSSDLAFAGNGAEVLAVWSSGTERAPSSLYGAILSRDGTQTPVGPLANVGQHPQLIAAGANAFVLTYEVPAQGVIVASRMIRLTPTRPRAVR